MRAQIAITRTGVTQASSTHEPPDGGVLARRTKWGFQGHTASESQRDSPSPAVAIAEGAGTGFRDEPRNR